MAERTLQLVLHYDGAEFSGWQRQPDLRTVQGVLESALARLCAIPVAALGAGRTDAGVHARGQAVGVRVPPRWTPTEMRRALNAILPDDVWVAQAHEMRPDFHARYSALSRRYRYHVGTDDSSHSPFRRRWEWTLDRPLVREHLDGSAQVLIGDHSFRAFAVRGTAPHDDDHRCTVYSAIWRERRRGLTFEIEANRFLHHMVRFLVGTMIEIARGRRDPGTTRMLLASEDNSRTPAPAPAHALFLDRIRYPRELYISPT
ncbi:MAG: tRNA pseudouridine(38-40) synthase TruA [Gemmatimonadaceae bacterium]